MKVRHYTEFELTENMTVIDLDELSDKRYKKRDFLNETLANKLGIYHIGWASRETLLYIHHSGRVSLYINEYTPILEVLMNLNAIKVATETGAVYNPNEAGIFKNILDNYFEVNENKQMNIEKILGGE